MQKCCRVLDRLAGWIVSGIFIVSLLVPIVLHGLFYLYKLRDGQYLYFVLILLVLIGGYVFLRMNPKMDKGEKTNLRKGGLIILFFIGGVARIMAACYGKPEVDAEYCLWAAKNAAVGNFEWADGMYFQQWGFQIPFVLFEAAILHVFNSVFAIHMVNVIASLVAGYSLYRIAKDVTDDWNVATAITALFLLMPSNVIRLGNPYNETISVMFLMLGLSIWIKGKREEQEVTRRTLLVYAFISGLMLGIGKLFRTDGIILLIAIACWYIMIGLCELGKGRKKRFRFYILEAAVLLGAYCMIVKMVDWLVVAAGINSFGVDNNCPYWKIVCGLTPDNYGSYHTRFSWLGNITNREEQKAAFVDIMKQIFQEMDLRSWIWFYFNKIYNMWVVEEWYFGEMSGVLLCLAKSFEKTIYFIILNISAISGFFMMRESEKNGIRDVRWSLMIAFIGYFLIYLLIESVVRYRYLPVMVLFILAAIGMQNLKKNIIKQA